MLRTVLHHLLQELHDDLGRRSDQHLALAALLGVEDAAQAVAEHINTYHAAAEGARSRLDVVWARCCPRKRPGSGWRRISMLCRLPRRWCSTERALSEALSRVAAAVKKADPESALCEHGDASVSESLPGVVI